MTPQQIETWIAVAQALTAAGVSIVGQLKALFAQFGVSHSLTDDQINAIEQAGIADDQARAARRRAMGVSS